MKTQAASGIARTRSLTAALGTALAALLMLWACAVESPQEPGDTKLRFDKIADSLADEGYDRLEITVYRPGLEAPANLYQGPVRPVTPVPMPDGIGDSYQVTLKAFDDQKSGLVFRKVYTISGKEVIETDISVIPVDPDPVDPDPVDPDPADPDPSDPDPVVPDLDPDDGAPLPATVEMLVLEPATLRIFAGGPAAALQASVTPAGTPLLLEWESSVPEVAAVGPDGVVKGLSAGTALVSARYKGNASKSDTCTVTVVRDAPTLDVGEDISVEVGATVAFTIKVTQEYGGIVEYRWSLDGDSAWEGIAATVPAALSREYTVAGDIYAHFSVKDGEGNEVRAKRLIRVGGAAAPVVTIDSPTDGFVTNQSVIDVAWKADNQTQTARLKDTLKVEGENTITRTFTNAAGATGTKSIKVVLDTRKPVVAITSPATGTISRTAIIDVAWKVDGQTQTFRLKDTLRAEGENSIRREFTDLAGNKGADSVQISLDSTAPQVAITSPLPGTFTNKAVIDVAWTVDKVAQTTRLKDTLKVEGGNLIKREITDAAGSKGSASVTVTLDTKAPVVAIASPADGATVIANPVPVVWTVDAVSQTEKTSETLPAGDGSKTITRSFIDQAGNPGAKSITVVMDLVKPKTPVMNAAGTSVSPTNAAGVAWKWTSGGPGGNGTFRYWMNSAAVPASPAPTVVTAAGAALTGLAEGTATLYVQEGDDQGNWSPVASQAIVIDRTLPSAIVFDGGAAQSVAAAAYTVSAAVSDAGSGLASVAVAGASSGNGAMTPGGTGTAARYTKAVTLKSGLNTLTVTATDKAGNARTGTAAVTYNQPLVTITSPPEGFVTNDGTFTITYTVGSNPAVKSKNVVLDDGAHTVTVSEAGAEPKNLKVYVHSNVVFVRKGAPASGNGSSWDNAFDDLDKALNSAPGKKAGNRIWISGGSYHCVPAADSDKAKVAAGVSLYGGFPSTGRPNTEAGRTYSTNKTILTNMANVDEGGLLDFGIEGQSNVDGIVFNQVKPSNGVVIYANTTVKFSNCEFHSTQTAGYFVHANTADLTFDKCTFSAVSVYHAIIFTYNSYTTISNSSFTNNAARHLFYLENWNVNVSTTTIKGNTSSDPDFPHPAIWLEKGTMTQGSGMVSDVPIMQN